MQLNLVICRGFGKEPLMLLTNVESADDRLCTAIVKVYLMRWRIEEYYKFKKQSFGFEKLLIRTLKSIRNLDLLLSIAIGYLGTLSEKIDVSMEVREIVAASKRLYGLSKFMFYALSDGLAAILGRFPPACRRSSLPLLPLCSCLFLCSGEMGKHKSRFTCNSDTVWYNDMHGT